MTGKMHSGAVKYLYQRARELRNNATYAETILWGYLRTKPLGFKFRRQHPYSIFILDFYCHALKLVIEADGAIHNLPDVISHDKERQDLIESDGLTVLRLTNDSIEQSFEIVIKEIEMLINKLKNE